MRIIAVVIVLFIALVAGCLDVIDHHETDSGVDANGMGSGSAMAAGFEESPRDNDLELVVLGASAMIALVPVGALRRRRPADDKDDVEPQFS